MVCVFYKAQQLFEKQKYLLLNRNPLSYMDYLLECNSNCFGNIIQEIKYGFWDILTPKQ